ncbi:MAG: hypothetical protein KGS61_13105, partial [Verrucomicrobia bacterium]|nr:hypothetical protein [Verrucomicrobiota bacterium]
LPDYLDTLNPMLPNYLDKSLPEYRETEHTYSSRFNRRHRLSGHVFAGRYKSLIVDHSQNGYLRTVCDYVHLNPVRARLVAPDQPLRSFRWSSFRDYLVLLGGRPPWLRVDRLLGEMRIPFDTPSGRQEFEIQLEARRQGEDGNAWRQLRRAWCYGPKPFRDELLMAVKRQGGSHHYAEPRRESERERAEQRVQEELRQLGWSDNDVATRPKGDPEKIRIARRLRHETTVSLQWIADRLKMGRWTHVSNYLRRKRSASLAENHLQPRPASTVSVRVDEQKIRTDPYWEVLPTHCL